MTVELTLCKCVTGTFVNEGFAGVPDAAPVKTLKVMSKKQRALAAANISKTGVLIYYVCVCMCVSVCVCV